ncbi:MAG: S8 family serine peptidase, partial [Anaerolineae bacterium]|nr:S8 family serine peptidase [Anaerolineae bacterium]
MSNRVRRTVLVGVIIVGCALLAARVVSGAPWGDAPGIEAVSPVEDEGLRFGAAGPTDSALCSEQVRGRYWEGELQSASVIVFADSNGQETTMMVPGPDDAVRMIVQLQGEPIALYKDRLKKQPHVSAAAYRRDITMQVERLRDSREKLKRKLTALGVDAKVGREYHYVFNGVSLTMKQGDVARIRAFPFVVEVYPDYEVHALLDESVPLIGAPQVWEMQDGAGKNVTGQGIRVAIIDTGIDYTHPDLGGGFGPSYKVAAGYDFVNDDADPMDDSGHGTHCAGIVAADGAVKGVAPDASLYAYKVLDQEGSGCGSDIIAAIERATDPDGDPFTDDAVDVISMSLGGSGDPNEPMALAVDAAADQGVVVVVAAGNDGPDYGTVGSPGVARKAFTVGATDKSDSIAGFSSRGPVSDFYELIKPDILAPGVWIRSTVPSTGDLGDPSGYRFLSGTSMSTPHVAGATALIKQLHPNWTAAMIQANLMNKAKDVGLNAFTQGAGRVQ